MHQLRNMDWPLIGGLGCLALVHPLLNITGLMDAVGRPLGPWLTTALISAVWIASILFSRVRKPLATLTLTGLAAGLAVLAVIALLGPAFNFGPGGLLANPIAIVAVLATNTLWGAIAGLAALGLRRGLGARRPQEEP